MEHEAELTRIAELVDRVGLDGLLGLVILTCEVRAREAQAAGDHAALNRWRSRARHTRAYRQMAIRVEEMAGKGD